jgi:MFS family permease
MDKSQGQSHLDLNSISRIKHYLNAYPSQFWLLFWGMLVHTTGMSMVWPFLVVYIGRELSLPLTVVASLITINAAVRLSSSLLAGPLTDRLGRKWSMVISLLISGGGLAAMIPAHTYAQFAVIMVIRGLFQPFFRVGSDAMIADLIPREKRPDAYALTRLSKNLGIALGPALGGLLAAQSYGITFSIAAGAATFFSILIALRASETLPETARRIEEKLSQTIKDYLEIFQDRLFTSFVFGFTLRQISGSILWVLLGAYTKDNYGLPESIYGLIPTTNALMVVFLQLFVTRKTSRYHPLPVMALGTLLYGIGVGSIALGRGFWGFWISMVVVTIGELMVIPTASTFTANRAPETMRGRYMSLLALTWGAGSMVGPLLGGILNDTFNPKAIWVGGGAAGLLGALTYLLLTIKLGTAKPEKSLVE